MSFKLNSNSFFSKNNFDKTSSKSVPNRPKRKSPSAQNPVCPIIISDSDSDSELEIPKKRARIRTSSKAVKRKSSVVTASNDNIKPSKKSAKSASKPVRNRKEVEEFNKHNFSTISISDDEEVIPSTNNNVNKKTKGAKQEKNCMSSTFWENHEMPLKTEDIKVEWSEFELLAQQNDLKPNIAKNLVKLFNDGNTIPFIARYRRNATENMSPEMLREVKESLENIVVLKHKIGTAIKNISKTGALNPQLEQSIMCARSIDELEIMYAPYKPGSKRTLAERAKDLGLEQPALDILHDSRSIELQHYVNKSKKDLGSAKDVEKGIIHIIAQIIATDSEMLTFLRELRSNVNIMLETKKLNPRQSSKTAEVKVPKDRKPDISKFKNYFDFKIPVKYVKPHQVLAINRGEHHKYLSVKLVVPDFILFKFKDFCLKKWTSKGHNYDKREKILVDAINDAYTRLVQPLIIREIRSELKTIAEKASSEVFSKNLKQLLLTAPLKGHSVLAIDPGFAAGCKLALVSQTGSLLTHETVYPHKGKNQSIEAGLVLKNMLKRHNCTLIAVGNGTACRETEEWLSMLIKQNYFTPLDIEYTIVNEDGASIYSCSAEAKKEFPDLDTNIISAVSLARRIQDPLAELVKIEPQHLGVGMYQHDLKKKTLAEALNEVVSECVSFVGVDLNTASQCLLRRIAGLSEKRATQILKYREKNGPFRYRKQLTKVFGIGPKIFEQCAGFLRVGPTNAQEAVNFYKNPSTTKLDSTIIHPESYETAERLLKKYNLNTEDIGSGYFINKVKRLNIDTSVISKDFDVPEETVKLILDALLKPINYDLRNEVSKVPLFRKGLNNIHDLKTGMTVTGQVRNVTHFGCFVDIGVGADGLIHNSKLQGLDLQLGDRVEVVIAHVEVERNRIGLEAKKKL